jgi:transmembrane sensor
MSSEFNSMEDLVFARSFRNWVLNRDSPESSFWESWIARNPDKAGMVKNAKAMIYALHLDTALLPEDEVDEEVRKALVRLKEAPRYLPLDGAEGGRRLRGWMRSSRVWTSAALFSGICVAGLLLFPGHSHRDVLQSFLSSHKDQPVHRQVADAIDDQTFNLPDGSLVRLGKNSKLYYSTDCPDPTRREVFLEGEAFFDIRKNPMAPFYVYTGHVITKVLGTSFVVHSFSGEARTTVTVLTGKVSVFRQEDFYSRSAENGSPAEKGRPAENGSPAGIVLTPNQQVVYDRGEDRLHKTLAQVPSPLGEKPDTSLVFHVTPVRQVFERLQELYGIPIQFDEEAVDSCSLTARMGNESFYEKLNIICKAIGGSYEVIDGNVVVTTPGCKQN